MNQFYRIKTSGLSDITRTCINKYLIPVIVDFHILRVEGDDVVLRHRPVFMEEN